MNLQQPILFNGSTGDPIKANALKQSLDYLDQFLEDAPYAAGDQLSIADFALLASITHLEGCHLHFLHPAVWNFEMNFCSLKPPHSTLLGV